MKKPQTAFLCSFFRDVVEKNGPTVRSGYLIFYARSGGQVRDSPEDYTVPSASRAARSTVRCIRSQDKCSVTISTSFFSFAPVSVSTFSPPL